MYHGHASQNLKTPPTPPRYLNSKHYHRLNLSFAISNSKSQQQSPNSPPQTPDPSPPHTQFIRSTAMPSFHHSPHPQNLTHSVSLYSANSKSKATGELKREAQHVICGFPKRKQRSGEQQLLKLLIKFNRHPSQDTRNKGSKPPLFETQQEARSSVMPKLRSRTRYNWSKDRYCANRDKEITPQNSIDRLTPKMSALRRTILQQRLLFQ